MTLNKLYEDVINDVARFKNFKAYDKYLDKSIESRKNLYHYKKKESIMVKLIYYV